MQKVISGKHTEEGHRRIRSKSSFASSSEPTAAGGITFAEDSPASFPAMPEGAVASGFVDFVLSPEKIGSELARIARHSEIKQRLGPKEKGMASEAHRFVISRRFRGRPHSISSKESPTEVSQGGAVDG